MKQDYMCLPRLAVVANERQETRSERLIQKPTGTTALARARDVMRQLIPVGEIDWPSGRQPVGRLDFNVSRPDEACQVRVDLTQNRASAQHFANSRWAAFRIFHTFSGP